MGPAARGLIRAHETVTFRALLAAEAVESFRYGLKIKPPRSVFREGLRWALRTSHETAHSPVSPTPESARNPSGRLLTCLATVACSFRVRRCRARAWLLQTRKSKEKRRNRRRPASRFGREKKDGRRASPLEVRTLHSGEAKDGKRFREYKVYILFIYYIKLDVP